MPSRLTGFFTAVLLAAAAAAPAQQIVVDNDDAGFSTPEGSWFPSANPGFVGTNSLLANTGGPADRARWEANLPKQGEWEVEAWWVAAPNRAQDAPFLINDPAGPSRRFRISPQTAASGTAWADTSSMPVRPVWN